MKPLAGNNGLPATGADGILAALSGNVARVDILQSGRNSDVSGLNEGLHRRRAPIRQLVSGVKTAHVPGGFDAQIRGDKGCQPGQLPGIVVKPGNNQGGDLHPDLLAFHSPQGFLDRFQSGAALPFVKFVAIGFQIHVGGIQPGTDPLQRLGTHVPIGDEYIFNPLTVGQLRRIAGKLEKNRRLGIGVGDAGASPAHGGIHHLLRCHRISHHHTVPVRRHLGDVRILAEPAFEIAAHRGDGIRTAAGHQVEKRFFFDRVVTGSDQAAVHLCLQDATPVFPHSADSPFAVADHAHMAA